MQTQSQLTRRLLIVAVFSLAGYLSAQIFISYSSWLDVQTTALHDKYAPGMYGGADVRHEAEAFNGFYREQAAMDKYATRKWAIFCSGFPVALTLSFLAAKLIDWLGHINLWQGIAGLIPVYVMPGPLLVLSGATWFLLALPCLAISALVLALSLKIITSRWSTKLFLGFLLSCAFCCLWGWSQHNVDMAWNVFFISLQVMWAGIFGMGLAIPSNIRMQQTGNTAAPLSTPSRSN